MHENLVSALYSLVQLHRWSKVVFISAFYIVTGLFDWLWCVFMVFNVVLLLFVNHLKDFFMIYRLPDDCYYPWNHGRTYDLSLDFFNNYSNHPRMCVLSTLCGNVDKHCPFDIYIYIYISQAAQQLTHKQHGPLLLTWINFNPSIDK